MAKHAAQHPSPTQETESRSAAEEKLVEFLHGDVRGFLSRALFVVLAILVVFYLLQSWRGKRAAAHRRAIAQVENAQSAAELNDLSQEFAGTDLGEKAAFRYARKLFEDGKYIEASDAFEAYRKQYPDSRFTVTALVGKAYAYEAAGMYAEAETAFKAAAETATAPLTTAEAFTGAGRCAEALNDLAAAKVFYEDAAATSTEDNIYRTQALEGLKRIAGGVPDTETAVKPPPLAE